MNSSKKKKNTKKISIDRYVIHRYIPCPFCSGKGSNERFPYYATLMPQKESVVCSECKGEKRLLIVPDDAVVVRASKIRPYIK